jgi:hypothetical protein
LQISSSGPHSGGGRSAAARARARVDTTDGSRVVRRRVRSRRPPDSRRGRQARVPATPAQCASRTGPSATTSGTPVLAAPRSRTWRRGVRARTPRRTSTRPPHALSLVTRHAWSSIWRSVRSGARARCRDPRPARVRVTRRSPW